MKKILNWQVVMGGVFITLSIIVYIIHYLIFRDARHIFLYLIGDIAFVFLEVFLVTLVIHGVLAMREKQAMLKKLNMVIGSFFSEVGVDLMRKFSCFDRTGKDIAQKLVVKDGWNPSDFAASKQALKAYACSIDHTQSSLDDLKQFLSSKKNFLLVLLENPNLLEHETFTNLLWAVFHLAEELALRKDLTRLPAKDYEHLDKDIKRAYDLMVQEWLSYMEHLKTSYPYLFSLAMRTNPFDARASVEVE